MNRVKKHWAEFNQYPCECGVAGCGKSMAPAVGIKPDTITLAIREDGHVVAQSYLSFTEAKLLVADLSIMLGMGLAEFDKLREQLTILEAGGKVCTGCG